MKVAICKLGRELSPGSEWTNSLTQNFPGRYTLLLFKPPDSMVFCYGSPSQQVQAPNTTQAQNGKLIPE